MKNLRNILKITSKMHIENISSKIKPRQKGMKFSKACQKLKLLSEMC